MAFDLPFAASTLLMEASGEPEDGQRAVAHVLVNRLHDGRWGRTLASVCLSRKQFSCWNENDPNRMRLANIPDDDLMLRRLMGFLNNALMGAPDPTKGSTHYYSTDMVQPPDWAKTGVLQVQFGKHRFYSGVA